MMAVLYLRWRTFNYCSAKATDVQVASSFFIGGADFISISKSSHKLSTNQHLLKKLVKQIFFNIEEILFFLQLTIKENR
jgi:hypothetical protein